MLTEERNRSRQRWRSRHPGRQGSRAPNFPPELAELSSFGVWLRDRVSEEVADGVHVEETVKALSEFPSTMARKYRSAYAYGYHYRVQSAEIALKTCDSGLAATFVRECRAGVRDNNPVVAPVEYVGHLEEIIELDYRVLRQVVFVGTWVRANYRGTGATVKKDQWGFTVANFSRMIPFGRDSFALPSQVQQVFFCDCPDLPGWKVVLRIEPRGKRIVPSASDVVDTFLFREGRDSDYVGLQIPSALPEEPVPLHSSGRVIRVPDAVDETAPEDDEAADPDLGASSDDD